MVTSPRLNSVRNAGKCPKTGTLLSRLCRERTRTRSSGVSTGSTPMISTLSAHSNDPLAAVLETGSPMGSRRCRSPTSILIYGWRAATPSINDSQRVMLTVRTPLGGSDHPGGRRRLWLRGRPSAPVSASGCESVVVSISSAALSSAAAGEAGRALPSSLPLLPDPLAVSADSPGRCRCPPSNWTYRISALNTVLSNDGGLRAFSCMHCPKTPGAPFCFADAFFTCFAKRPAGRIGTRTDTTFMLFIALTGKVQDATNLSGVQSSSSHTSTLSLSRTGSSTTNCMIWLSSPASSSGLSAAF
mmetsp:Transcript_8288/g.33544  ORF Transcript_8288/g.33544 Transcript_8288/m.33544 type:complete len:301 (-) Transcript_8288:1461-2363(-)